MDDEGFVTLWIGRLKDGDEEAAQRLWEHYFARLVGLARHKIRGHCGADRDEEDVALSALNAVYAGVAQGHFPRLGDRDDLWRLLVMITARKALGQVRDSRCQKRGGGNVRAASDLAAADPDEASALDGVVGREPSPEFTALVADEVARRLDGLRDETLRQVALLRLDGHTAEKVAAQIGCTVRTVTRKLELIRRCWQEAGD